MQHKSFQLGYKHHTKQIDAAGPLRDRGYAQRVASAAYTHLILCVLQHDLQPLMELFSFYTPSNLVVILDEKRKAARLAALSPNLTQLLRPEMSPNNATNEQASLSTRFSSRTENGENCISLCWMYRIWERHYGNCTDDSTIKRWHVRSSFWYAIRFYCNCMQHRSQRVKPAGGWTRNRLESMSSSLIWNDCYVVCAKNSSHVSPEINRLNSLVPPNLSLPFLFSQCENWAFWYLARNIRVCT